jgi:hypothetical protein
MQHIIKHWRVFLAEERHNVLGDVCERLRRLRWKAARQTWQQLGVGPCNAIQERRVRNALHALSVVEKADEELFNGLQKNYRIKGARTCVRCLLESPSKTSPIFVELLV